MPGASRLHGSVHCLSLGAEDAQAIGYKVWVYEQENVLMIHHWAIEELGSLLVAVTLREPAGE